MLLIRLRLALRVCPNTGTNFLMKVHKGGVGGGQEKMRRNGQRQHTKIPGTVLSERQVCNGHSLPTFLSSSLEQGKNTAASAWRPLSKHGKPKERFGSLTKEIP